MKGWYAEQIAYCANVHPGTTADDIEANLVNVTAIVREKASLPHMSAGLWLCEDAVEQYQDKTRLQQLKQTLQTSQLQVVTCNGFPVGDFHQDVVKQNVYLPTWADTRRLDYTKKLASILAECMPQECLEGSISTLPLAYRIGWQTSDHQSACTNLLRYAQHAHVLGEQTGKHIRLCLEMEPGCVLERTPQLIDFFTKDLPRSAHQLGLDDTLIHNYLGICFDVCHQAVMHEDIEESIAAIDNAGIVIGKVQISSALEVSVAELSSLNETTNGTGNNIGLSTLKKFAEPKYMHQLSTYDAQGGLVFCDDLVDAMANSGFPQMHPWRIHYHLPIQQQTIVEQGEALEGFSTTRASIEACLDALKKLDYSPHIEIETYTWHVLPEFQQAITHKTSTKNQVLIDGLCRERDWLLNQMQQRNLLLS